MPIQPSGRSDAPSASPPEPHGWASQSQRLSLHQGSEGGGGARGPWEEFVSNPPKAAHVALAAPHSARFGNRINYNMEAAALFALGGVRRGEKVLLVGSHWHYLDILRRVPAVVRCACGTTSGNCCTNRAAAGRAGRSNASGTSSETPAGARSSVATCCRKTTWRPTCPGCGSRCGITRTSSALTAMGPPSPSSCSPSTPYQAAVWSRCGLRTSASQVFRNQP